MLLYLVLPDVYKRKDGHGAQTFRNHLYTKVVYALATAIINTQNFSKKPSVSNKKKLRSWMYLRSSNIVTTLHSLCVSMQCYYKYTIKCEKNKK